MKEIFRLKHLYICVLFILSSLAISCKKEKFDSNATGKVALSEEDLLDLNIIDTTITLQSFPVLSDSIRTDEAAGSVMVGSYIDPEFGKSEASFYTQLRLSSAIDFLENGTYTEAEIVIDAMELHFDLDSYYGKEDDLTFEVYQMDESISFSSDYYSNDVKNILGTNLIDPANSVFKPTNSSTTFTIKLDPSLGSAFVAQSAQTPLSGNDETDQFVDWFKGLYIKVTSSGQVSGEGAIMKLNLGNETSGLTMRYHNTTDNIAKTFEFVINSSTAYFSTFSQDYSGTNVEQALNDKTKGNESFYVQSMGGVNSEIMIPYINNLSDNENIVIRKAELVIPYVDDAVYDPISSLLILTYNEEGEKVFLADQFIGEIGGVLNTTDKNYVFNITNYLNQTLINQSESRLLIAPIGAAINAKRSVLSGQNSVNQEKIKLNIYYSKF